MSSNFGIGGTDTTRPVELELEVKMSTGNKHHAKNGESNLNSLHLELEFHKSCLKV